MDCEWFRWYPALYKADTMHLTAEQDGIYRRLIDHYMDTRQPLPDSDTALVRIAGVSTDAWAIAAAIVRPFFTPDGKGNLHQKRCDIELDRQDGMAKKQSEKGKAGAAKRWGNQKANGSGHDPAIAQAMPGDSKGEEKRREDNKKEEGNGRYFFEAENIHLTEKHYVEWKNTFYAIPDFKAALLSLDGWAGTLNGKWFHAVKGSLNKKHQEFLVRQQTKRPIERKPTATVIQ